LWVVYFLLDGFVLGAGMLYPFLAKDSHDKKILLKTIGPVWDGNEVWLIMVGAGTFAVFPAAYALLFSYLYPVFLLLLFALIVRGVSIEFREELFVRGWRKTWDGVFVLSSFLPAFLFGVLFGNLFLGLPFDAIGYHGSFLRLLNGYSLLMGALFVLLFLVHGSLYASLKITGPLTHTALHTARRIWIPLVAVMAIVLVLTSFTTRLGDSYRTSYALITVPLLAVLALIAIRMFLAAKKPFMAFVSSSAVILFFMTSGFIGLFPNLIPSSIDASHNLTAYNASASPYALKIMLITSFIFFPLVIGYTIWAYYVFRERIKAEEVSDETSSGY